MLKLVKGDLLQLARDGEFEAIVQGCNCFCTMGSGIARQIREEYPEAYKADCATAVGDYNKLGSFTYAKVGDKDKRFFIINAYTQYDFNRGGKHEDVFEYVSFELILQKLAKQLPNARFGFPFIGMGLAGGNSVRIIKLLEEFAVKVSQQGGSVTLVEFAQ